jgi:hypothetical protein
VSKHHVRDGLLAVCISLIAFAGTRAVVRISQVRAQTSVTAFTLQTELYDSKGHMYAREIVACRSDGTRVVLRTGGPLLKPVWARKISSPDGREVHVHEAIGAKTTFQPSGASKAEAALRLHPPPSCIVEDLKLFRTEVLFGQNVAALRREKAKSRTTDLLAQDLGCERLGYTYEQLGSDRAWKIVTEQKPVSLVLGEPDPKLFEIPVTAVETKPSVVSRKYRALWGQPEAPQDKAQGERRDQRYLSQPEPGK